MIKITELKKTYNEKQINENEVLKGISCEIEFGKFTTIVGPSGSGKSTFMKCISGLESITSGTVEIDGKRIDSFTEKEMNQFRKNTISYIFQEYNLINDLTMKENVCFDHKMTEEIKKLIELWGLEKIMNLFPKQCSGGQQQKIAILRALQKNTKIIFCDEPTGALDSKSAKDVLEVLKNIQAQYGTTIIMITHNNLIEKISDTVITIQDGMIKKMINVQNPLKVAEVEW